MENGREMGNLAKKVRKAANKEALADAIARDEEFGRRKTQREYAEEFGVTDRTIRGWIRELEEDI
jgi:predicted transcriptional regulator